MYLKSETFGQKNETCIIAVLCVKQKYGVLIVIAVRIFCQKITYCCLIYMENMLCSLSEPMKSKLKVICFQFYSRSVWPNKNNLMYNK